jgi:hypothetical protein
MDDEQLQIRASALADRALTRITAEIGPRAIPTLRDSYLATAECLAKEEIGDEWEFRVTLDMEGKVYVFMEQYRGRS